MGQDCVKLLVKIRAVGICEELRVAVLGEGEATQGEEKRQEALEPALVRKEQTAHCWEIRQVQSQGRQGGMGHVKR